MTPIEFDDAFGTKPHDTINGCMDRPISPGMRMLPRAKPETFLANKYLSGAYELPSHTFDATTLRIAISAVFGGATSLFMCHSAR